MEGEKKEIKIVKNQERIELKRNISKQKYNK